MKKLEDPIRSGFVRVTDVLSPFTNFDCVDKDVLNLACDRGTRVHQYCQSYILNIFIDEVDEDCKPYFDSFVRWFDEYVDLVLGVEIRLYHQQLKFTGQVDLICRIKGDKSLTIVDFKTPTSHSRTWALQTAAYLELVRNASFSTYKECICVSRRMALRLSDKQGGDVKVHEYFNHERDIELFKSALSLNRFFQDFKL